MSLLATTNEGGCGMFGNINTDGTGYVGGQLRMSFFRENQQKEPMMLYDWQEKVAFCVEMEEDPNNKIDVQVGSWIPLQVQKTKPVTSVGKNNETFTDNTTLTDRLLRRPQEVNGYFAINMLGSTTAVETKWNTNTDELETKKYFSMRLHGGGSMDNNGITASNNNSPPMWLTMTSTPQSSTINISQILSFDRYQTNVIEDRAPYVRNTLAWSVQVENPNARSSISNESMISAAIAWQCNRGLALKLTGFSQPQKQKYQFNSAILLKRWKQPRLTCSILHRFDFASKQFSFLGLGLELDTDASSILFGNHYYATSHDSSYHVPSEVPETKAALP
jgi:hypothetical protein